MFGIADDNGYPTKTKMKITSGYRSSFFKDTRRQQKECLDKQSARTINELSKNKLTKSNVSDVHSAMLILIISEDILILQNLTNPTLRWVYITRTAYPENLQ